MKGVTFIPNLDFAKELVAAPEYNAGLMKIGGEIADNIRALTPEDQGILRRTISATNENGQIYVRTKSWYGHIIEWGSVQRSPVGMFWRGTVDSGLRFTETPKGA
jgi:hypothetical protein